MIGKDLLQLRGMPRETITEILDTAEQMREVGRRKVKKVPPLRGRLVVTLFFENSTRTKTSFELAAKRLSADTLSFNVNTSSTTKGETLMDTARTIYAMQPDAVVVRHSCAGAPHLLARSFPWRVLNAGDGIHEHPSQGLLDMLTIRDKFGSLEGRRVAIVGDVQHSRVARSNIWGLTAMGARVVVAGPGTMCRRELAGLPVEIRHTVDEVVRDADVIMLLRIQHERLGRGVLPSTREYAAFYGLDLPRLRMAGPDVMVMHPGPINRGVEIGADVADSPQSVILDQVTNGIAVRMALLYLLLGSETPGVPPGAIHAAD